MPVSITPVLGLRGSGAFASEFKPDTWRKKVLEIAPNGVAPLIALTSVGAKKGGFLTSETVNWTVRRLATQNGAVTHVYINSDLSTLYEYDTDAPTYGSIGGVVYCKVAEATAKMFRIGHHTRVFDADRYTNRVNGKVVETFLNGASSFVAIQLKSDDGNDATPATYNLETCDMIRVIGNVNPQGGLRPNAITYVPTKIRNVTAIWRTPAIITGTQMAIDIYGIDDNYNDNKAQALLYHAWEMEKDLIFSKLTEETGPNGENENTIMGIEEFLDTYAADVVDDYRMNADYSGLTWEEGGWAWLQNIVRLANYYGTGTRQSQQSLVLVGDGAKLGLAALAEEHRDITMEQTTIDFGLNVERVTTPFGSFNVKDYPTFNYDESLRYSMLSVPPAGIKWAPLKGRDTKFRKSMNDESQDSSYDGYDGKREEFLTEGTYEYDLLGQWFFVHGVGLDNEMGG